MNRRRFLRNGTLYCGGAAFGAFVRPIAANDISAARLSFYVAGVRFYKVATQIGPGCELRIGHEIFKGTPALPVFTVDGVQIGYVPQKHVATVCQWSAPQAYLNSVDQFAVPWKRYEVIASPRREFLPRLIVG
jgi:hypothetical protein